jgi:hypothetical protein
MTTYSTSIVNAAGASPVLGDDVQVVRSVTGLTTAQTIDKAWLTVKSAQTAADADAALQLSITTSLTAAGQITDDGTGATTGEVTFTIASTDYTDIVPGYSYWYDVKLLLSDGQVSTLEVGRVTWNQGITDAIA